MRRQRKSRVFPYYIIVAVDEGSQKIRILDLNTIQERKWDGDKEISIYEKDTDLHDAKWILVPGTSKTERTRIIAWMKSMMGDGFMAKKKCMVYNHRAHWTNPIHEEYKRAVFEEWEAAMITIPELEVEEIDEDSE